MVKPLEPTGYHNSRKYLILLPLKAIYFRSFYYETPCNEICNPVIDFLSSILAADESDNEDSGIGLSPQLNGHEHRRGSHIQINTSQYD